MNNVCNFALKKIVKMEVLSLSIFAMAMLMLAGCTQKNIENMQITQEWDKVFPLSEKVNHRKVEFKNQYGIKLVGDLYSPKNGSSRMAQGYDAIRKPNPVPENKELLIIPGASHCDLYDGGYTEPEGKGKAKNMIPWDKMEEFFRLNLDKTIEQ